MEEEGKAKSSTRTFGGWLWKICLWSTLTVVALGALAVGGLWFVYEYDKRTDWLTEKLELPNVADLRMKDVREQSEVTTEDGRRVACFSSSEHRIRITAAEDIPPLFKAAIVASEDKRFYEHDGVDYESILRAWVSNKLAGRVVSGASTLEMQIAKNWILKDSTKSYSRKLKEAVLAWKINREFSKPEILLMYVNMPYFGRGQYGIEAASRSYFGKPAASLSLEEVALVVGIINQPNVIERVTTVGGELPSEAKRRARYVIERLRVLGSISDEEYEAAQVNVGQLRVSPIVSGCSVEQIGPYFTEEIRRRHKDRFALNTGGLQIFLPVDPELQKVAEEALRQGLDTYRLRHTHTDEKLAKLAEKKGVPVEQFKKEQAADRESIRGLAFGVDFAGRVRFMIGGEDFAKSKFNVATQGFRQPGSTFKAFTYAALDETNLESLIAAGVADEALLQELDRRCTVKDAPVAVSRGKGKEPKWISNFRTKSQPPYRGQMTCRLAIAESRNTAAIRAGQHAGVKHMVELAKRLGLGAGDRKYELQPYPTTAIGASDVVPIDMSAYLAFVNGGYKVPLIWEYDICSRGVVYDETEKTYKKGLLSVLYTDPPNLFESNVPTARKCAPGGVLPTIYERVLHPVVAEHMKQMLQEPLDAFVVEKCRQGEGPVKCYTGTARSLRTGTIPGFDSLGEEIKKLKPEEKKARTIAFPIETSGEIAAKTGTASNTNGDTSDAWFIVLIPGQQGKPETGMLMVFWMGKTTKTSLGSRETGGRNLVPVAAKVMQFLKEKRGLLQPGNKFEQIIQPQVAISATPLPSDAPASPEEGSIIDPTNPDTDPEVIRTLPPLPLQDEEAEKGDGPDVPD